MSSKHQTATTPAVDSIPDKDKTESLDSKFELTESNLRSWLLGPFDRQRAVLKEAAKRMEDEGISNKLISRCLRYETTGLENHYKETLKLVINPKTQKFWDIPTLQNAGKLSDTEIEGIRAEHNGREPPFYYVSNIRRVLDDRQNPHKEYLTFNILFEGLCVGKREGHMNPEPNMRINVGTTIGYHLLPKLSWDNIKDEDGEEKRVTMFDSNRPVVDLGNNRIYEIGFSKEIVAALMKHTRDGQVAFGIDQLSKDKHYGINSIEEFLADDLQALVEQLNAPKPTINIDSRGLYNYLKADQASKEKHQYQ
jgi:hypothetical protein